MTRIISGTTVTVNPMMVGKRSYLSTQHLWMAEHCAAYAEEYESRHSAPRPAFHVHLRGHVLACITESVAFLEALVNELLEDAFEGHNGEVQVLGSETIARLAEYQRASQGRDSILTKYALSKLIAGLTPYDKGANPYQDADLLIRLRNWQIHYRPETIWGEGSGGLGAKLRGRFDESALMASAPSEPWFPDKALGAPCARWCVATARAFAQDFADSLGYEPNFYKVEHSKDEPEVPTSTNIDQAPDDVAERSES